MKSSRPSSAHWRSSKTRTAVPLARDPLEEGPPRREQLLAAARRRRLEAEQGEQRAARSSAARPRRSRTRSSVAATARAVVGSSSASAIPARRRTISPSAQNVMPSPYEGDRPRCQQIVLDHAVEVLLELPGEPALADAGLADDRHEPGAPLARRRVELLLEEAQLVVPADERRPRARRPGRRRPVRATTRDGAPRRHRRGLALEHLLAGRLEGDAPRRAPGGSPRRRGRCPAVRPDWRRVAVLTRSPATMPWLVAPTVTAASPVSTPARACSAWSPSRLPPSAGTASTRSSAAGRPARRRPRGRPACPRRPSPRRR